MVGPPKQFDSQQVLVQARDIFWAKGFEATSMQDLVDGMGISRASMYNTFGGKREIFCRALRDYGRFALGQIERILNTPGSPCANLKAFLEFFLQESNNNGCLIGNTAVELGPHDQQIATIVRESWKQIEGQIIAVLDKAIQAGEFPATMDKTLGARLINCQVLGMVTMRKAGVDRAALLCVAEQLIVLLQHQS